MIHYPWKAFSFKVSRWASGFFSSILISSPSQCSYVLIEFYSQLLDCLHHSHQPHVCIFSGIAWVLIFFRLFLLGFIEVFHPVFFKLLKSFEAVYDFSFNFCVLGITRVILIGKLLYRFCKENIGLIIHIVGIPTIRYGHINFLF